MAGYGNPEIEWQRIQDMVSRYGEPSEEPELQEPLPPFHDVRLYRFRFRCARTGTVHELNVSPAAHALWRGHGYPGIHNALPLMYGPPALGFVMPPFDPVFRHQLRQWPQQQQSQCQQPFPPAGIHPGAGPSTAVVPAPWEFPGSANHYNMLWVFGARPFDIQAPLQVYDGERIIWTDYGPENGRNVEALRLCHEEEGRSQLPIQLNKNVPARCVIEQNAASFKDSMQTGHRPQAMRDNAMASAVQVTRLQDRVGPLEVNLTNLIRESQDQEEELQKLRQANAELKQEDAELKRVFNQHATIIESMTLANDAQVAEIAGLKQANEQLTNDLRYQAVTIQGLTAARQEQAAVNRDLNEQISLLRQQFEAAMGGAAAQQQI